MAVLDVYDDIIKTDLRLRVLIYGLDLAGLYDSMAAVKNTIQNIRDLK